MALALQDLLSPATIDIVRSKMLAKLQARGLPTTDWNDGNAERTILEACASAILDLVNTAIPTVVGGGFVDTATGDWLTYLSQERYANIRNLANYTQGTITLTNSTNAPQTVAANQLWFSFPSGNLYNGPLTGPVTIPPNNGSIAITVQSQFANHSALTSSTDTAPLVSYVDQSDASITMVTPLPGVRATNVHPPYGKVTLTGVGTGTITTSGTPTGSHNVRIRIDISGQAGIATYSYSVDGAAYVTGQTSALQSHVGSTDINFTLSNGAGTPSFVAGDIYGFSTPGSWITQQGTDQEPDSVLASRDRNKWPSLSTLAAIPGSPTLGFYDLLARQASNQVTQTLIQADPVVNNQVNVYVGGQGGVLPAPTLAAIQSYFSTFNMLTDRPLVLSPTPLAIVFAGATITVRQASLVTAQAALQAALQSYIASLGINGSLADGKVKHGKVVQIIEDIFGIVDVTDTTLTINGAVGSLTLPTIAGQVQLPTWSQTVATAFTWATV
jgi:hypothetical protein